MLCYLLKNFKGTAATYLIHHNVIGVHHTLARTNHFVLAKNVWHQRQLVLSGVFNRTRQSIGSSLVIFSYIKTNFNKVKLRFIRPFNSKHAAF